IIKSPQNGYVKLEYWLAKDPDFQLKARAPITEEGKPLPSNRFDQIWTEHLGQPPAADPDERLAQEQAYIKAFKYRAQPLVDEQVIRNDLSYADAVLDAQKANCNVANTLLTISNPTKLNYVIGFGNSNTKEQEASGTTYLSANEAHAWT